MSRIAIVGSCITRDLWRFRGEADPALLYVSRTSLPSLLSSPAQGFQPKAGDPPGGLRPQPHRALVADLAKTALATLLAYRPTHVIFDFIDERFDLLSLAVEPRVSLVTDSWELEASGYRAQPVFEGARPIHRLSAACDRLWIDAAAELAAVVRGTPLRHASLILHSAQWADQQRLSSGATAPLADIEITPGRAADIAAHNVLLARYEAAFCAIMPPMARLSCAEHRLADEGHPWGLSPFHYVPEYYAAIWSQMEALGIGARRRPEPS